MTAIGTPGDSSATSFTIRSEEELHAALDAASGTGPIVLKLDAAYGPYNIALRDIDKAGGVEITALDPAAPPVIGMMELVGCKGITFSDLDFRTVTPDGRKDAVILRSEQIAIRDSTMTGAADGFMYENGPAQTGDSFLFVRDSSGIEVTGNRMSGYFQAIGMLDSSDITVRGNELSHMQGDGFVGGGLSGLVIDDNYIHSFYGSTQSINHTDMIQLWGSSTKSPNRDIEITNNVLLAGDGMATQGILIRNEEFDRDTPASGYFTNVTISGNLVHNAVTNGIYVADIDGLTLTRNTVLRHETAISRKGADPEDGDGVDPWINIFNHRNATITGNVTERFRTEFGMPELSQSNLLLSYDDPDAPTFVDRHIVDWAPADPLDARNFLIRSDSPFSASHGAMPDLDWLADLGPILTFKRTDIDGYTLASRMQVTAFTADGVALDADAMQIRWTLADGTVLDGPDVTWAFDVPGRQEVAIEITDIEGRTARDVQSFILDDPTLLRVNFDGNVSDTSQHKATLNVLGDAEASAVAGKTGGGFHLTPGTGLSISRDSTQLFGLDRFDISMDLRIDADWQTGTILELYQTLKLKLLDDGSLSFNLATDMGRFTVQSAPTALSDGEWHRLNLRFDDSSETLSMLLDGAIADSTWAEGSTSPNRYWNMTLGPAWGATPDIRVDNLTIEQPPRASVLETITISTPLASPESEQRTDIDIGPDELLFRFEFDNGIEDTSSHGTQAALLRDAAEALVADGYTGGAFELNQETAFEISRDSDHLSLLDNFQIDMDLRLTTAPANSGLLSLHTLMDLDLRADGSLRFWIQTDESKFFVSTGAGVLDDTDWHRLSIVYSDAARTLAVAVDGEIQGQVDAGGTTGALTHWGFALGTPWGANTPAVIDNFQMTTQADQDWAFG
jgi:hypothetical protein